MRFLKKQKEETVELRDVKEKVAVLESRIDSVTEVLIASIKDPWAQGILRSIHTK